MLAAITKPPLSTRKSALDAKDLRFNPWHFKEELVRVSVNDVELDCLIQDEWQLPHLQGENPSPYM